MLIVHLVDAGVGVDQAHAQLPNRVSRPRGRRELGNELDDAAGLQSLWDELHVKERVCERASIRGCVGIPKVRIGWIRAHKWKTTGTRDAKKQWGSAREPDL